MQHLHPKIKTAIRSAYFLDAESLDKIITIGHVAFTTQQFIAAVAQNLTTTHLKAAYDFIDKFLGDFQECEAATEEMPFTLSYFTIKESGREGYTIILAPHKIIFRKIISIDGLPQHKDIMSMQI